ncbi:class I SAM-dependent methyltransferase [Streptomyces sp. NPDC088194]|uniref:class I SAM-dependent methyltransferase n=1 Tax=Streptomyces sp. NPDC088194 TaxID=3154931 RepID=UPI00344CB449
MVQVYEDRRLAGSYHAGNDMPDASLRAWAGLIADCAPVPAPRVLEVGAGTGMFAAALARWTDARLVVGVEPSPAMLAEAHRLHPAAHRPDRLHFAAGRAEAVPLRPRSVDLALLSRVIHHLPDRRACARELARVLRPGGVVVVRTTFRERLDAVVYTYWPRLLDIDRVRFPAEADVRADFAAHGFEVVRISSHAEPVAAGLRAYHQRLVTRPQSKFTHLTEAEFATGLARLAADAKAEAEAEAEAAAAAGAGADAEPLVRPRPVSERYDVAVFRLR